MRNEKIKYMTLTGLFASMICLTTAFILHIQTPNGYIHLGDTVIYIASCMLPAPYGILAAGVGGGLADLLCGYPVYILPTFIIKSLNSLCFYAMGKRSKMMCAKTVIASVISCFVTVLGYYLVAVLLYGNYKAQIINTIPSNAFQGIASGLIFIVFAYAMDKMRLKQKV